MKRVLGLIVILSTVIYSQQKMPFSINDFGLIFIEAKINGQAGTFILDTGGGAHVVSTKFYDKIKESLTEDGIYTGFRHNGERIDAVVYKANSISAGGLVQSNPFIGVYPPLDEYGIDGLVSLKLFEENAFTIDFINKEVVIETKESLTQIESTSNTFPIQFDRERDKVLDMFITICINDTVSIQAEFDTGAGKKAFYLNQYYSEKLGLQLDSLNRSSVNKISLCGSEEIIRPDNSVIVKGDLIYEGLIGSGMFIDKKLTIDIPNSRVLVRGK